MATRPDLDAALDVALTAFAPTISPTPIVRDAMPAGTRQVNEFVRVIVLDGAGLIDTTTGLQSVDGSIAGHSFVLRFDIFTNLNEGTGRASVLAQHIIDRFGWSWLDTNGDIQLADPISERIGEEPPRYHTAVGIDGVRYETLTRRR